MSTITTAPSAPTSAAKKTFGTLCNTATTTLSVIDATSGMALAAVNNAAKQQAQRHAADRVHYIEHYSITKAKEIEQLAAEVQDWLGDDKERTDSFNSTLAKIQDAMRKA